MPIDTLSYSTAIDLRGFDRDLRRLEASALASFDRIARSLTLPAPRVPTIEAPRLGTRPEEEGAGGGSAAEVESSLAPLSSLRIPALDAVAGQVGRLAPLMEKAAGAIILQFRRADAQARLPLTKVAVQKARDFIAAKLDDLPPKAQRVAGAIDNALGGVQFGMKVTGQVRRVLSSLTGLDSKIASEAGRAVGPMQAFGSVGTTAARSVESATNKATGAVRGFGVQLAAALGVFGLTYKGVEFFRQGIKGASDYNEALNSSQSILEGNAGAARALSDSLARDFGLAKRETLELATSLVGSTVYKIPLTATITE